MRHVTASLQIKYGDHQKCMRCGAIRYRRIVGGPLAGRGNSRHWGSWDKLPGIAKGFCKQNGA